MHQPQHQKGKADRYGSQNHMIGRVYDMLEGRAQTGFAMNAAMGDGRLCETYGKGGKGGWPEGFVSGHVCGLSLKYRFVG